MVGAIRNGGYISPSDAQSLSTAERRNMIRSGQLECETCRSRKYQDGSDEMVSYKAPAHISPESAGAAVRAHEQEHVVNAYNSAAKNNGQVISANVSLQTSVCPECGRTYVSGGTTTTQIKYNQDAYAQNAKVQDKVTVPGNNVDYQV